MRKIGLVGSMDTKGTEFALVKGPIEEQVLRTLVVDFGVLGEPQLAADVTRAGREYRLLRDGSNSLLGTVFERESDQDVQ